MALTTARRGIYFTIDGMFAAFLIVGAIVLLLLVPPRDQDSRQLELTAQDGLSVLSELRVGDIANPSLVAAIVATNDTTANDSVLRAIGVLWATNNSLVNNLTVAALASFDPKQSYAVYAEGQYLGGVARIPQAGASRVSTAHQQVSGIAQGKPVAGSTATGLLRKIQNRTTSSYVTFGGFVGQGNITTTSLTLPSDFNSSRFVDATLEMDTPSAISLVVNGFACGTYTPANPGNSSIESWSVTGCGNSFTAGANTVELRFSSALDLAYVSGGFLRVRYTTDQPGAALYPSPFTDQLPGITGIVNLYDAFYVPGNVSSLKVYLHYVTNRTNATQNNPFYLTIGNTTVWQDNTSNSTVNVTLTDVNLTPLLNYSRLGIQTVPIRLGFLNLTFATALSGASDVMLVTDTSGSMAWWFSSDGTGGTLRECADPNLNLSTTERLSVAKCLDKQFTTNILNVTGNRVGVVSFSTSTNNAQTVGLGTNATKLNLTIGNTTTGYSAGGNTCICCGIDSAVTELTRNITKTTLIAAGSSWKYLWGNGSLIVPTNDSGGNAWYNVTYLNESSWKSGAAVLGSLENGTGPAIVTDMNNSVNKSVSVPDMSEMSADRATPEVDFTSGLNSTGNTFGIAGANDGWDWQGGTYGYDSKVGLLGVVAGRLVIDANTSPSNQNNCASDDCSGAYGISFNVTPALYAMMTANGVARLSFYYQWDPNPANGNPFTAADEVWVKARWTKPGGFVTNFGTEISNSNGDSTPEVAAESNPSTYFNGTYSTSVSSLINGSGIYYLDFGGKLSAHKTGGWGRWRFDNVLVSFSNYTDIYYLRKNFTISNISTVQTGILNVLSDDRATIYLNGVLLLDEGLAHNAQYWNVRGLAIPQANFRTGTNELAVRLENDNGTAKFDLRLEGINTSRPMAMLAMTDGVSNQQCAAENTGDALTDAIQSACTAKETWGITVHTVGFSNAADNVTLAAAAACGNGLFTASANVSSLADFYNTVVVNILASSLRSQSVIVQGSFQPSTLFPDSYIQLNHNGVASTLLPNEVAVTTQTSSLNGCSPTINLMPTARILQSRITSYSGEHWTDFVSGNGRIVYNLSDYATPYTLLGDPYLVYFPSGVIRPGANTLTVNTGDSPSNGTGCSPNDTLITDLAIPINPTYTPVLERADGCKWTIEQDSGGVQVVSVPRTYAGNKTCAYTSASVSYDADDAYDIATYNLLQSLDYDLDGRIFISLAAEDVEIIINTVSNVPYLWGPSLIEVRSWQ